MDLRAQRQFTTTKKLGKWVIWLLIKHQFEIAMNGDYVDLQALIMFLVFEKQVLTMDDHISSLDRYFLEKHSERMNQELLAYKGKMSIEYGNMNLYEVMHDYGRSYITAYTFEQAKFIAARNKINVRAVSVCPEETDMMLDNEYLSAKDLTIGKPRLIGGFHR